MTANQTQSASMQSAAQRAQAAWNAGLASPSNVVPVAVQQAIANAKQTTALTPEQALDMINRSAITGVPTSEFDSAGGYDKVMALARQAGWNGAPSQSAIAKYGQQVADTGVGNLAYAQTPTTQQPSWMTQPPSWLNDMQSWWNGMQTQASNPATANGGYVSSAFPQYTPNYSNALMRPISQGSGVAPQQGVQNLGYSNQPRTTIWGDV